MFILHTPKWLRIWPFELAINEDESKLSTHYEVENSTNLKNGNSCINGNGCIRLFSFID